MSQQPFRAQARIDLGAISANVRSLTGLAGDAAVMAVVKADGYGHGMVESARAALAGGASWLGVAYPGEALALRAAGIDAPTLAWLSVPGEDLTGAIAAGVDIAAYDVDALDHIAAQARLAGRQARVHLKVDTGLSRGGATSDRWPDLCEAGAKREAEGDVRIVGLWSHLVHAGDPRHPTTDAQLAAFQAALDVAQRAGLHPEVRHLANSTATLTRPDLHFDVVRPGIAVYGLSPVNGAGPEQFGLRPAMTLVATLALAKRVAAGSGLSYGHTYRTARETRVALVPLGYADGIPRAASNVAEVLIGGQRRRISGTVCMDQFVVDVGDADVQAGDEVLLFGPGDRGEPTAQDWAVALDTISYEIVTRIGPRTPRVFLESD